MTLVRFHTLSGRPFCHQEIRMIEVVCLILFVHQQFAWVSKLGFLTYFPLCCGRVLGFSPLRKKQCLHRASEVNEWCEKGHVRRRAMRGKKNGVVRAGAQQWILLLIGKLASKCGQPSSRFSWGWEWERVLLLSTGAAQAVLQPWWWVLQTS